MMIRRFCIALFLAAQTFALPTVRSLAQQDTPRRPQTPKPPFPYKQREAAYSNSVDGTRIFGTLTIPAGAGPHPAVIMIPDSGGADRDATAAGHKPFLVIADYLTRRGVAVLRADSRKPDKYLDSTCEDFAGDALAGIDFLKKQMEIDAKRIGVIGHSLGGMVAPMVAARSKDVAFVVSLAGLALPVREVAQMQRVQRLRAKGMPDDEARQRLASSQALYDRLVEGKDNARMRDEVRELLKLQLPPEMGSTPERLEEFVKQEISTVRSRYYKFLHTYDPRVTLRRLKCPILALNGSLDQAVSSKENLGAIEQAMREAGNTEATIIELYGLNHFFQTAKTGSPTEIAHIEETMVPKALWVMGSWIRSQARLEKEK